MLLQRAPTDKVNERFVVIADARFSALLASVRGNEADSSAPGDEVIWTFQPDIVYSALEYLMARVTAEQPYQAAAFSNAVSTSMPKATSLQLTVSVTTKLARLLQEQAGRTRKDPVMRDERHAEVDCGCGDPTVRVVLSPGQGVSYVLFKDGTLHEYHDANSSWSLVWISGIQSFDAGTDKYGVNAVDCVFSGGLYSNGDAWMISDTDGWHHLMSNVHSRSAAGSRASSPS